MTNVLSMSAFKVGNPVEGFVLMKAHDFTRGAGYSCSRGFHVSATDILRSCCLTYSPKQITYIGIIRLSSLTSTRVVSKRFCLKFCCLDSTVPREPQLASFTSRTQSNASRNSASSWLLVGPTTF